MKFILKNKLFVSFVIGISVMLFGNMAMSAKTIIKDNIEYSLNELDKTASIINGRSSEANLEVPSTIIENEISYKVASISDEAFSNSDIAGVILPESINVIGKKAFAECKKLIAVSFSESDIKIEEFAFYGSGLTDLKIPEGVSYIGDSAFSNCTNLKTANIPASVDYLGNNAFSWCATLESVDILDGVTNISDMAFYHCTGLKSIKMPDSVTSIGKSAFEWCSSLESIEFSSNLNTIGDQAFARCGEIESVSIPMGVSYIGSRAFDSCRNLSYIDIPESVNYIGELAFGNSSDDEQTKLRRVICVRNSYVDSKDYFFTWNQYGVTYPEFSYKVSGASTSGSIFGEYSVVAYISVALLLVIVICGIVIIFKGKRKI